MLLFDNTTDPYSPAQIAALARTNNIRWLIIKRSLQLNADPMPQRDATLQLLAQQFTLYRRLGKDDEGRLTRLRAALVSRRNLSRVAARAV